MKKVSLTESDLTRIIKNIVNEQNNSDVKPYKQLLDAMVHFHPELKDMSPNVAKAVIHIFGKKEESGVFNMRNMKEVCTKTPEFCKAAFTTPEVINELVKVIG